MLELHELAMNSASLVDWKGEGLLRGIRPAVDHVRRGPVRRLVAPRPISKNAFTLNVAMPSYCYTLRDVFQLYR